MTTTLSLNKKRKHNEFDLFNLPTDLFSNIQKHVDNSTDLLNLKLTCKHFNKSISSYSLAKSRLSPIFNKYTYIQRCVNDNCFWETVDVYENAYNYYWRDHFHLVALNKTFITVNKKNHIICSPYCHECLIKYILIGDNKFVSRKFIENEVQITYKNHN